MLPGNHGAYTVGKSLRRPIMKNITSFIGKSNLVSVEAMGSAIAGMSGKRASPMLTRSISSNSPKTWQPSHGIIFKDVSAPGSPRHLSTASVAENEQNLEYHSYVEDSYVLANAHVESSETQKVATVAQEDSLEPETAANAQEVADGQEIADEILEDPAKKELPISESTYQMTEELFKKAKNAEPETPESYWSHTLYRGPEENGIPKKVKVHYCRSLQTTEQTLQQHFLGKKVLGFDIEWKAEARAYHGPKKNVSLIQLATEERIGLFHIALFPQVNASELVAPTLKKIMEDPKVTKVGVAISADCTRLRTHLNIGSVSIFELSHLHRLVKYTLSQEYDLINKRLVSLAKQVEEHLHLPLFKGGDVRASDWSRGLSIQQISYAASDSYAGFHLYDILETKRQALDPTPPRPSHADQNAPIPLSHLPTQTPIKRKYTRRQVMQDPLPLDPDFSLEDPKATNEASIETANEAGSEIEINDLVRRVIGSEPPINIRRIHPAPDSNDGEESPVLLAADVLTTFYLEANPESKVSQLQLVPYFIWYHNAHLSIPQIASICSNRDNRTIIKRILTVISVDKLPYEKHRLRDLLEGLSKNAAWENFRGLVEAVDTPDVRED
ncbi:putative 3 -5 exonuclease helicase protein [Botrytis fragariae]|uniref:Putative 3 -5 exonuclease helicase protein n=1 Tax=Botrytis fragariae TaxID=1964551 RepID=A0A8H6EEH0_9HELO|nr:putative 3 -5 exonuclease helicase protein [Botrytis fragariae]KAF5868920.1 putative 3 -5 exonuclease helicase protein [Botrytis fragariae]